MNTKKQYLVDLIFKKLKSYKKKRNLSRKRETREIYFFTFKRQLNFKRIIIKTDNIKNTNS